jgi:hypothetical protein
VLDELSCGLRVKAKTRTHRGRNTERASKMRVRAEIRTSEDAISGVLPPLLLKILQKFSAISKNINDDLFLISKIVFDELSCGERLDRRHEHEHTRIDTKRGHQL